MKAVILEKRGKTLVAIDEAGEDLLAAYPDGKRLAVTAHAPVNEKHYRLWWALVNKVIKSGAWNGSRETFHDWILIHTQRVRSVVDAESGKVFFMGSLSIDSFTDDEWRQFFEQSIRVVCEKLLGEARWAWLRNELNDAVERRNPNYRRMG